MLLEYAMGLFRVIAVLLTINYEQIVVSTTTAAAPAAAATRIGTVSPLEDFSGNDLTKHPNIKLLPRDCGLSLDDDNVGDENASMGQYPWLALIGYRLRDGKSVHICGGTLINGNYVLTAAHCLFPEELEDATLTHVTLGEFDTSQEIDCDGNGYCNTAFEVEVVERIPHESFNSRTLKNDIALLRLNHNVMEEERPDIVPVCLPLNITKLGIKTDNYEYETAGWGILVSPTEDSTHKMSPILQKINLYSSDCNFCQMGGNQPFCPIADTQFCAIGYRSTDVCKGDSGGPLMTTTLPYVHQLGIKSFKNTGACAANGVPSVFTNVSKYMKWILDHIR